MRESTEDSTFSRSQLSKDLGEGHYILTASQTNSLTHGRRGSMLVHHTSKIGSPCSTTALGHGPPNHRGCSHIMAFEQPGLHVASICPMYQALALAIQAAIATLGDNPETSSSALVSLPRSAVIH